MRDGVIPVGDTIMVVKVFPPPEEKLGVPAGGLSGLKEVNQV